MDMQDPEPRQFRRNADLATLVEDCLTAADQNIRPQWLCDTEGIVRPDLSERMITWTQRVL